MQSLPRIRQNRKIAGIMFFWACQPISIPAPGLVHKTHVAKFVVKKTLGLINYCSLTVQRRLHILIFQDFPHRKLLQILSDQLIRYQVKTN
jgi:hypothetical protein